MKKIIFLVAAMPMFAMAQTKKPAPKVTSKSTVKPYLKSSLDSLCYALGTRIAPNFKNSNIDTINYDAFVQGIKDYLKKKPLKLNDSVCNVVINTKLQELTSKIANKEKSIGKQFLDSNKTKQGIVTTASGLQYEVITMGTGIKPTEQDTVVCHYKGTLTNGKEFDNSYARGEPITFPTNGVIKGWIEALQLMPKGSKWKLYIPSDLGYGDRGAGQDIPGGAVLIFEVELLDVKVKQ